MLFLVLRNTYLQGTGSVSSDFVSTDLETEPLKPAKFPACAEHVTFVLGGNPHRVVIPLFISSASTSISFVVSPPEQENCKRVWTYKVVFIHQNISARIVLYMTFTPP